MKRVFRIKDDFYHYFISGNKMQQPTIQDFVTDINNVIDRYRDHGLKSSQLQLVFIHSFLDLYFAMKVEKMEGKSDEEFPGHDPEIEPGFSGG